MSDSQITKPVNSSESEMYLIRVISNVGVTLLGASAMLMGFSSRGMPMGMKSKFDSEFVLLGVAAMPVFHLDSVHLINNLIGLFFASIMPVFLMKRLEFFCLIVAGFMGPAVAIYLIGESGYLHIGASGMVWCLWTGGLIYSVPWILKGNPWVVLAAVPLAYIWLNLIPSLFPEPGVSWEGHIGGFLAGVICAGLLMGMNYFAAR